jgi:hypothetical protein
MIGLLFEVCASAAVFELLPTDRRLSGAPSVRELHGVPVLFRRRPAGHDSDEPAAVDPLEVLTQFARSAGVRTCMLSRQARPDSIEVR